MVRSKMRVSKIEGNQVYFETQYDPTVPEDQRFTVATPWGNMMQAIDNPAAIAQLEVGKAYYIDISPAE